MNYELGKTHRDTIDHKRQTLSTRQLVNLPTFIILIMLSLPMMAQKEAEAKAILEQTSQAFKKSGGIEADFSLTPYSQGMPQEEIEGSIRLMDENFRLTTPTMVTWFDGKTQWTYLPTNEEVNVSTPTREEVESINPLSFLTLYKEGYAYQLGQKTTYQGKSIIEVKLTAEDTRKQWANLTLYIESTTHLPLYIKLKEAGKDYHEISISNYQLNKGWKKSDFTFNTKEYPDVEVIDLR